MPETARVEIEGMTEVRAAFRRLGGPDLVRQLGQVHKRIGEIVIRAAGGAATGVGEGIGSTIRPSANTREVLLLVGGRHRAGFGNWRQWGVRQMFPPPGRRPFLVGAAVASQQEINNAYLDGVQAIAGGIPMDRS